MLTNTNMVGRIAAVREIGSNVLVACKVLGQQSNGYKIEYAAGNTEFIGKRQVSIAPSWLVAEWYKLRETNV